MQHIKYGIPLPTLSHIDLHVWKCALGLVKFGDGTRVKSDLVGNEVTLSPDKHSYNVSRQLRGNMIQAAESPAAAAGCYRSVEAVNKLERSI